MSDEIIRPFVSLQEAMRAKDPEIYSTVEHMRAHLVVGVWKKVHPEDFPMGEMSPASPASIIPKAENID